jgi:hypothetical protein
VKYGEITSDAEYIAASRRLFAAGHAQSLQHGPIVSSKFVLDAATRKGTFWRAPIKIMAK